MFYKNELELVLSCFEKRSLSAFVLNPYNTLPERIDLGLNSLLGRNQSYNITFYEFASQTEKNTIYRFTNSFLLSYIYFELPDIKENSVFVLGPFLKKPLTQSEILTKAELHSIPAVSLKAWEQFYENIPVLKEGSLVYSLLEAFCEKIWGGIDKFSVQDVFDDEDFILKPHQNIESDISQSALKIKIMEQRYAFENEMLKAVEEGQIQKAEGILERFSSISFEQRLSDRLRNIKNYCIIMNTLLRKAAENGGAHPIYIDSVSSEFATEIESLSSTEDVAELMLKMFRSYCRLVRKHAMRKYSPPVQNAILLINSDLTADLSLKSISGQLSLSAGYLSALFKKETGRTLTEYVNLKRVKYAQKLLGTTNLQIGSVAQYCGFLDINYFSRVFKKLTGKTPKEFRQTP